MSSFDIYFGTTFLSVCICLCFCIVDSNYDSSHVNGFMDEIYIKFKIVWQLYILICICDRFKQFILLVLYQRMNIIGCLITSNVWYIKRYRYIYILQQTLYCNIYRMWKGWIDSRKQQIGYLQQYLMFDIWYLIFDNWSLIRFSIFHSFIQARCTIDGHGQLSFMELSCKYLLAICQNAKQKNTLTIILSNRLKPYHISHIPHHIHCETCSMQWNMGLTVGMWGKQETIIICFILRWGTRWNVINKYTTKSSVVRIPWWEWSLRRSHFISIHFVDWFIVSYIYDNVGKYWMYHIMGE